MIEEVLEGYINSEFLFEFNVDVTKKDDLFKAGVIDSFGYIKMIKFLEERFEIEFEESELMSVEVSFEELVKKIEGKGILCEQ